MRHSLSSLFLARSGTGQPSAQEALSDWPSGTAGWTANSFRRDGIGP